MGKMKELWMDELERLDDIRRTEEYLAKIQEESRHDPALEKYLESLQEEPEEDEDEEETYG